MKNTLSLVLLLMVFGVNAKKSKFPDGSKISSWFSDYSKIKLENLGKKYFITDFGVKNDSTIVKTAAFQAVKYKAAESGGIVVIPEGVFLSGALFFKPKKHLYISEDAKFKGSDNINETLPFRMEYPNIDYLHPMKNACGLDCFTISRTGTKDSNYLNYHKTF